MKIAMYYANDDVRLEEAPRPEPGPGEALMRVMACGICGSDVMQWYRRDKVPLVLGHEVAGVVEQVGKGTASLKVGDRVVAAHHVACDTCQYCRDNHQTVCDLLRSTNFHPGGMSQYLLLPQVNVQKGTFPMPEGMDFEQGTFVEPLACVLRGQKAARVSKGKSVLVIGSGISGALHVSLARALGAALVVSTDLDDFRLDMARKCGAHHTIRATDDVSARFRELSGSRSADAVILTAGTPQAIGQAFDTVDRGGTVLFFAPANEGAKVTLPVNRLFWKQEITLTSSYAASHAEHMEAMDLIASGRVNVEPMITHRLPLNRAQEGFRMVAGAGKSLKVIIEPHAKN